MQQFKRIKNYFIYLTLYIILNRNSRVFMLVYMQVLDILKLQFLIVL